MIISYSPQRFGHVPLSQEVTDSGCQSQKARYGNPTLLPTPSREGRELAQHNEPVAFSNCRRMPMSNKARGSRSPPAPWTSLQALWVLPWCPPHPQGLAQLQLRGVRRPLVPSLLGRMLPWLPGPWWVFEALGQASWGAGGSMVGSENRWAGSQGTSLKIVFLGLFGGQRLKLLREG